MLFLAAMTVFICHIKTTQRESDIGIFHSHITLISKHRERTIRWSYVVFSRNNQISLACIIWQRVAVKLDLTCQQWPKQFLHQILEEYLQKILVEWSQTRPQLSDNELWQWKVTVKILESTAVSAIKAAILANDFHKYSQFTNLWRIAIS